MLELIREPFLGPKQPICPEQNFLVQTIVITFIYLLAIFIVQNLKKFLQRIQNYDDAPFLGPKWSIFPKHFFFFLKIITIILIYLLVPFIVQNFKKILPTDPELWGCAICGPKWPISPNKNFFRKRGNEPCFFFSCLYTCQKSKSDINQLVKYCWFKNTEISLAESNFCL